MKSKTKLLTLSLLVIGLAGCYRIPVQQGNIMPDSAIQSVKVGMTRFQIEHLFGMPVMDSVFADNQEVFVYTFKPNVGEYKQKRLIVYFNGDTVTNFTTDYAPVTAQIPAP